MGSAGTRHCRARGGSRDGERCRWIWGQLLHFSSSQGSVLGHHVDNLLQHHLWTEEGGHKKPQGHTVPSSPSTQGLPPARPYCGGVSCVVLSACARSQCPHSSSKHPEASLGMGAGAAGMLQAPCPASQPPQPSSVAPAMPLGPLLCGGVWGPPVRGAVPCCSRKALGLVEGDCTRLAGGMRVFVG